MVKGKLRLNWFSADQLRKMDDMLPVSDFTDIEPFYDACEEELLEQGFELWDGDIIKEREGLINGVYEIRYNCAVVKGTVRNDKIKVKEIGIAFYHIKKSTMTDLDKLVHALNNLRMFVDGNGNPQEDSLQARKYLEDYIHKMRETGVSNLKQLLK